MATFAGKIGSKGCMRKLFGTDGIRGLAGDYPLDQETVFAIGQALGHHLAKVAGQLRVVIGQDTRESGAWIADTLAAGLASASVIVESAGVVTTPAIAYLAHTRGYSAGVVISASHNPWTDNGIKVFGGNGFKLADSIELDIEVEIFSSIARNGNNGANGAKASAHAGPGGEIKAAGNEISTLPGDPALRAAYEDWLAGMVSGVDLSKLKVVVDCANGAASEVAVEVMKACGVQAEFIHRWPNGKNINDHCGALYPEVVAAEVVTRHADLGISFDGDADRALFADAKGKVVNGDAVLLLAGREMAQRHALPGDTVVATTMSNMGLESAFRRLGIKMLRAPVGDKYVLEEMQKNGAALGGEQSGHIIFSDLATTGDGLLTALKVMEIVARSGQPIHELLGDFHVFPQVIKNVRVREKRPLEEIFAVAATIQAAQDDLKDQGRVVVRYSGTEALCRVMIEASSQEKTQHWADEISSVIQKDLGA